MTESNAFAESANDSVLDDAIAQLDLAYRTGTGPSTGGHLDAAVRAVIAASGRAVTGEATAVSGPAPVEPVVPTANPTPIPAALNPAHSAEPTPIENTPEGQATLAAPTTIDGAPLGAPTVVIPAAGVPDSPDSGPVVVTGEPVTEAPVEPVAVTEAPSPTVTAGNDTSVAQ